MGPGPLPRVAIVWHITSICVQSGCRSKRVREGEDASVADITLLLMLLMVSRVVIVAYIAEATSEKRTQ